MILDLTPVFADEGSSLAVDYELSLADVEFGGNFPLPDPVKIKGTIKNRAGVVTFTGTAMMNFEAPCDRCARDCGEELELQIFHILVREVHNEESEEMVLIPDGKLDTDELFRCDVILGLPSKHLCGRECKGICGGCGKNLNLEQCVCKKPIDPRFEALAELLED